MPIVLTVLEVLNDTENWQKDELIFFCLFHNKSIYILPEFADIAISNLI